MATDYSELGYNQNMTKDPIGADDSSISSLEADSQFGDGSLPGMKLSSGPDIATFGFADNFDSSYPFILPYYIDSSSKVVRATISLFFQPYRAYETAASSGGGSTSGSSSSSTTGSGSGVHNHSVTIGDHTHSVTLGNHTHGINLTIGDSTTGAVLYYAAASPPLRCSGGGTILGYDSTGNGGGTTVTSGSGGGSTPTSADATPTHSHGMDHTHSTPNHTHGITYGIYSSGYPTAVSMTIDGVDVTTALGGPWNPSLSDPSEVDMDITAYTGKTGSHTIQLTTTGQGRCIPMLIIKSVIGSKS